MCISFVVMWKAIFTVNEAPQTVRQSGPRQTDVVLDHYIYDPDADTNSEFKQMCCR